MTTVYLLHFERPIGNPNNPRAQAQHYCGCTEDLEKRLELHRKGWSGAGIVKAFHKAGIKFVVARIWEGSFELEQYYKRRYKSARQLCPICRGEQHG